MSRQWLENQRKKAEQSTTEFSGCPGQRMRQLHPESGHNTEQSVPHSRHSWHSGHARSNWFRYMHRILMGRNC